MGSARPFALTTKKAVAATRCKRAPRQSAINGGWPSIGGGPLRKAECEEHLALMPALLFRGPEEAQLIVETLRQQPQEIDDPIVLCGVCDIRQALLGAAHVQLQQAANLAHLRLARDTAIGKVDSEGARYVIHVCIRLSVAPPERGRLTDIDGSQEQWFRRIV